MKISGSLVLYRSRKDQFEAAILNFLQSNSDGVLYVVDNSPEPAESRFFSNPRVKYLHVGENIGFGAGHNRAISLACHHSDLHLILNPDIRFEADVLDALGNNFRKNADIAVVMPKVVYPDGSLQRLCKLLPTPVDLIVRRFFPIAAFQRWLDKRYEMHDLSQEFPSEVPTLSGCFLLVRSQLLIEIGGFDERYFMYMEDVDLVRRLGTRGKVLYMPVVSVVHEYAKGSYKNYRLLGYHIKSAIKYFNKWGWIFDAHRRSVNQSCLRNCGEMPRRFPMAGLELSSRQEVEKAENGVY